MAPGTILPLELDNLAFEAVGKRGGTDEPEFLSLGKFTLPRELKNTHD